MKRGIAFTVAALALGACAHGSPDRDGALPEAPANWSAPADGSAPEADWLGAFGDPVLPQLVAEALAHNTDLRAAAARLRQARASATAAGAPQWPSLDLSFRGTGTDTQDPFGGGRTTSDSYTLGLNASWELDVWGRVASSAEAGDFDALASEADYAGARLSLAGATAQAWFALIEAELQTALAERDVRNRENSLDFINRRYAGGVSSSLDVRLARSALASARATLTGRRQAQSEAARTLEVLLGRYPAAELAAARDLPAAPPLTGVGTPADLLWRRPDLVAADMRLESAGFRAGAARAALLPRLSLQAGGTSTAANTDGLLTPESLASTLIANIAQPLFSGGALRAEAARAAAVTEERLAAYAGAALTAWREAENALTADARLAEREEQQRIAFEEAARAEELAERQYRTGLVSIFNLLDAQTRRITSEGQYISARRERAANRVRLHLAIGGDFAAPLFTASPALETAS